MAEQIRRLKTNILTSIYNLSSLTKVPLSDEIIVKNAIIDRLLENAPNDCLIDLFCHYIPAPEAKQGLLLAFWLRVARDILGVSQTELGRIAGLDQKAASKLETNEEISISSQKIESAIERISSALKATNLRRAS